MNPSGSMLVATRSFTYTDEYGQRQQVKAGITHWAANCDDLRRFPDAFALPTAAVLGQLARSAEPTRSAGSRTHEVEVLVGALPRAKVWLTYHARGRLEELLSEDAWPERGGFLYGHAAGADDLVVTDAVEQLGTPRTRDSVELDLDAAPRCMGRDGIIGDWHIHPKGIGLASRADANAWHNLRHDLDLPLYAGLVYVRSSDGFDHSVKAWIAHDEGGAQVWPGSVQNQLVAA